MRQVGGWYTCRWLVLHLYAADATDVVGGGALRDAYVSQVGVCCLYAYKCTVCKGFIWRHPLCYTRRSHSSILTPTLCLYWECSAPVEEHESQAGKDHCICGQILCVWLHHLAWLQGSSEIEILYLFKGWSWSPQKLGGSAEMHIDTCSVCLFAQVHVYCMRGRGLLLCLTHRWHWWRPQDYIHAYFWRWGVHYTSQKFWLKTTLQRKTPTWIFMTQNASLYCMVLQAFRTWISREFSKLSVNLPMRKLEFSCLHFKSTVKYSFLHCKSTVKYKSGWETLITVCSCYLFSAANALRGI